MRAHMQKEQVDDLVVATEHTETETLHIASPHKSRLLTAQNIPPALLLCKTCLCYEPAAKNQGKPRSGPRMRVVQQHVDTFVLGGL